MRTRLTLLLGLLGAQLFACAAAAPPAKSPSPAAATAAPEPAPQKAAQADAAGQPVPPPAASLSAWGGCSESSRSNPAPSMGTVKYDWLELTVGDDGEHVYRAEIDSPAVRRRDGLTVEVKADGHWFNAATATKEAILAELGNSARPRSITDGRIQELYHGADNEVLFVGGSFAFQGDVLWMVALLDGSSFRMGGAEGEVIPIECERSTIQKILGEPTKLDLRKSSQSKTP